MNSDLDASVAELDRLIPYGIRGILSLQGLAGKSAKAFREDRPFKKLAPDSMRRDSEDTRG
jgi:hypothetical protein